MIKIRGEALGNSEKSKLAINKIRDLPMLPTVVNELNQLFNSPGAKVREIAAILEKDTGLSSQVLKLANSPFYGFSREIKTLIQAIPLLGIRQIQYYTLGIAANRELAKLAPSLDYTHLCQHAFACSSFCRKLAQLMRQGDPDEIAIAGMLHDVGHIALACVDSQSWDSLNHQSLVGDERLKAEKKAFGINHAEAGALLAEKWKLPKLFCSTIGAHHKTIVKNSPLQEKIVAIADNLCEYFSLPQAVRDCSPTPFIEEQLKWFAPQINIEEIRLFISSIPD